MQCWWNVRSSFFGTCIYTESHLNLKGGSQAESSRHWVLSTPKSSSPGITPGTEDVSKHQHSWKHWRINKNKLSALNFLSSRMHKSGGRKHEIIFEANFLTQPSLGPLSLASPPRKQELTGNDGAPLCVSPQSGPRPSLFMCDHLVRCSAVRSERNWALRARPGWRKTSCLMH